jgi:hypothetical protein
MATQKPLVIDNGTTQQIANADTLSVGVAVEPSTGTALRIGDVAGTTITTFPGPVRLDGDVTTVGGTTFTTDATFEGNVTFGNGPSDTVTFAATTTVVSDINFATPVAYKITNLANGTNPNDAVNVSQLSALVTGVSAVTASSPLASSGGATPDISFPTWPANASGVLTNNGAGALSWAAAPSGSLTVGTTAIVSGAVNRVLFEGAGNVLQESANLTWDGSTFTVGGVLSLAEGAAPSATASFGKFYALNTDSRPYFLDDGGQAFNLTLDRFNTLTPAASVAINTSPALPVFNSLALNQNTTFTTSNLGNGRSASVRVICDGTTRTLTFPGTWTWLGSGPPADLAANDVGYLSITAYGATDADVVAAWSYENMPAVVTSVDVSGGTTGLTTSGGPITGAGTITLGGTLGVANGGTGATTALTQGSVVFAGASGVYSQDNANLFWDNAAKTLKMGVETGGSGGTILAARRTNALNNSVFALAGNGDSDTGIVFDGWNIGVNTLSFYTGGTARAYFNSTGAFLSNTLGGPQLNLGTGSAASPQYAGVGGGAVGMFISGGVGITTSGVSRQFWTTAETVINDNGDNYDFRVESDNNANMLLVDASQDSVSIGTTGNTHTFNIGTGASANFCVASGGRIHTYDGSAPTNGQVLIGDTALGNFAKATLTAGTGISITNGAGSVTIAASNAGGVQPITTIGVTTTLGASNYTVLCSATLTVNLPAAASNTGRIYNIKNIGAAATITIDPDASETIDGATTYTLTTQYESVTLQCDGTAWFIL